MSHELDFSTGRAAIAYRGATPWHGLGETIEPGDSLETIQHKGGIDYSVEKTVVQYSRKMAGTHGDQQMSIMAQDSTSAVLYRSDDGTALSVVGSKYIVVQPKEIIEFYRELVDQFGYQIETVGALKGGRKIWALANTNNAINLRDQDKIKGYLLLATSYDTSMATTARFTAIRVVCNNTITMAVNGAKAQYTCTHAAKFDAEKAKETLQIGTTWEEFAVKARYMTERAVTKEETVKFLLDVYHSLGSKDAIEAAQADEKQNKTIERTLARLTHALFESPGAKMASANGTLWGLLNAVTNDVDFAAPSRSQDTRLDKAWFGSGEALKNKAWALAGNML